MELVHESLIEIDLLAVVTLFLNLTLKLNLKPYISLAFHYLLMQI